MGYFCARYIVERAEMALPLVYSDDALLVLNKPSGLLSVPGRGEDRQDCMSKRVQQQFAEAQIVHRLDMGTSGLLLMARGLEMQRLLQRQFALREVQKSYIAIVQGQPAVTPMQWQCVDAPLMVDWPNRPRSIINAEHGKPSRTFWRVLDAPELHPALTADFFRPDMPHAVLEVMPETGRSHQIRVHLQSIGHAVAGDNLYGDAENQAMAFRLLLHACLLALKHPGNAQPMRWECATDFR